ncbi:MAG: 2Fe-2S iron-sulfur cluster-binding protein [Pseudomonadota bacterium]
MAQITLKRLSEIFSNIEAPEHQTILESGLQKGLSLPFGCMAGVCHTCKAQLVSGEVDFDPEAFSMTEEEKEKKMILLCQAKPKSAQIVLNYLEE